MPARRQAEKAAPAPPAKRPEYERGKEWPIERLTGKRAQKGKLGSGMAKWTYEVEWKPTGGKTHPNTFEPAEHLVGNESRMKEIDVAITLAASQMFHRPVKAAIDAKEAAAKAKADELAKRRTSLLRKQRRQRRESEHTGEDAPASAEESDGNDDDEHADDEFAELTPEQTAAELLRMEELLRQHGRCVTTEADAAKAKESVGTVTKKKKKLTSAVWLAFDQTTNACTLPHPQDKTRACGAKPGKGSGTSGHIQHLERNHSEEWVHILAKGERKTTCEMIKDAFAAKVDMTKPPLPAEATAELHRLVALWVAKCGRPQAIVEDPELNTLLARILELCKSKLRYSLPCQETVSKHLKLLGNEGKTLGRDFIVRLLKSGVKPSISGDLWSEGGMGLFGIYAHGISETWVMEKALIGLVACEKERHTADNIKKWTKEALLDIGIDSATLIAA